MKARIYDLVQNRHGDGPGNRMVVYFQGCLNRCHGCSEPGAQEVNGGIEMDTEEIKRRMSLDSLLTGLTLSGGEPFLQPEAGLDLAGFAHSLGLTVWCYTGYRMEDILDKGYAAQIELLKKTDVLVDGPYEQDKRVVGLKWRVSGNQRLIDVKTSLEKGMAVFYDD